jgi:MFS family permease
MSSVALAFAVLGSGGNAADLGYVFAAGVIPQVILMLTGGVVADRVGRRPVMLGADALRCAAQSVLAGLLLHVVPPIWVIAALNGLLGTGEAFFSPSLSALTPDIAPPGHLGDANALISVAQSVAKIGGPALAGILIAVTSPGLVIACDAGTYGVSVVALSLLRLPRRTAAVTSPLRDLADGWREFRGRTWLWVTTLQFTLFNLFTWAPYLLLGPVLARDYLGGARAWGLVVAAGAVGAIGASAAMVGRRPGRPLVAGVIGTLGYPMPCLMLALHAPLAAVAAGALAAGAGGAVNGTLSATVTQEQIPPQVRARVMAFVLTGAYALGSAGFAVIGPLAAVVGPGRLLGFAAAWGLLAPFAVLAVPAVRSVRQVRAPAWQSGPVGQSMR